ncbi:DHH family phosphoesterase [Calorimonas adulescens]|jgi:DHHA1 domain./DHH family.|uniref:Cyclic-di-AMP phosphodiesterase n=1 Tax=Calorimonas adulescens TaxID=2606906 RepID=A0A5D8Q8L2_9THEO|nr:DHH family phosphoesterase [Calorimonas adulescens]TZE80851.1 exopolyphosphatase [Calorimonas adulescens]
MKNRFLGFLRALLRWQSLFTLVVLGVLTYFNVTVGIVGLAVYLTLLFALSPVKPKDKPLLNIPAVENIALPKETEHQKAFIEVPMPVMILRGGKTVWKNEETMSVFGDDYKEVLNKYDSGKNSLIEHKGRYYQVSESTRNTRKGTQTILYFNDVTELYEYKGRYEFSKPVICLIQVDNYDEVMNSTEDIRRPVLAAEIDKRLSRFTADIRGCLRKYSNDKYILIFENGFLKLLEEKKFTVLDDIRDINEGNKIPVTLSMGIGADGENPQVLLEYASNAMDLALGRGGDQAVVKRSEKIFFYGGKTQTVEKRTRVKVRVISHALRELIQESSRVFIMGHTYPDFDCLGASMGMYRAGKELDKDTRIVWENSNSSLKELMEKIMQDEEYRDVFTAGDECLQLIDERSLLIVVDAGRPGYLMRPELLEKTPRIVVIDHHRKTRDAIANTVLSYIETYASSTSEMVTEILQYIKDRINLKPIEAVALLTGINLDTKNFTYKTGVRTFDAAAYLRLKGADTMEVRQYFQDELVDFTRKAEIIRKAEIWPHRVAVAVCPSDVENRVILTAQVADELLNIKGVDASFVLCDTGEQIIISGRSLGEINVQVILEELGGGGHYTEAGAQVYGRTVDEVKTELKRIIEEKLEEVEE